MKIKVLLLIALLILLFAGWIFYRVISGHQLIMYKQKIEIIKDGALQDFFPLTIQPASVTSNDTLIYITYKEDFYVNIWKFNSLKSAEIKLPVIETDVDLSSIDFKRKEILGVNLENGPYKHYKKGALFNNHLSVSVDSQCEISKSIKTERYCGFYGHNMKKVLLSDIDGIPQVFIEYPNSNLNTMFLFGIKNQQLYVIFIDSEKQIVNDSLVDLFEFD